MSTKKISQQTLKEIKQFVREREIEEFIEDLNISDESDDSYDSYDSDVSDDKCFNCDGNGCEECVDHEKQTVEQKLKAANKKIVLLEEALRRANDDKESQKRLIDTLFNDRKTTFIYEYCDHCKPKE